MLTRFKLILSVILSCLYCSGINAVPTITDQEIEDIYNSYIKPNFTNEYSQRYVPLPLQKNTSSWNWKGKDFPRVISLLEFERFITANNIVSTKALAVNGIDDPEWKYIPHQYLIDALYPANPIKHDLHKLDLDEKDFDFVMINQTLEHVYDPITCLKNVYQYMRSGGILYINVPANSIPHSLPFHYYTGYTPIGLAVIAKLAGFNILSVGQWGNVEYLNITQKNHSWADYTQFANPGSNDLDNPVITWIFAVKP